MQATSTKPNPFQSQLEMSMQRGKGRQYAEGRRERVKGKADLEHDQLTSDRVYSPPLTCPCSHGSHLSPISLPDRPLPL